MVISVVVFDGSLYYSSLVLGHLWQLEVVMETGIGYPSHVSNRLLHTMDYNDGDVNLRRLYNDLLIFYCHFFATNDCTLQHELVASGGNA